MASKYENSSVDRVPAGGGSIRMTIASNVAQGNGGTSLPCKRVWLIADKKEVRVTIGTACTATTGIPLGYIDGSSYAGEYLMLEIADVSSLYFYCGSDGRNIDCLYRE